MVQCWNREYSNKTESCKKAREIKSVLLCRLTSLFQKLEHGLLCFSDPCKQQHCAGRQTSDPLYATSHTVWIGQNASQWVVPDRLSPCCAGGTSWTLTSWEQKREALFWQNPETDISTFASNVSLPMAWKTLQAENELFTRKKKSIILSILSNYSTSACTSLPCDPFHWTLRQP